MRVVTWDGGRVSTSDAVEVPRAVSGARLRDAYAESVRVLTFGVARLEGNAVRIGPLELLRFGEPRVSRHAVDWPIEGGLLAARGGGRWRIACSRGRIEAALEDYSPSLPRLVYAITQLQVHDLFTHLFLLRARGPEPAPGPPARREDRVRGAAVDVAFCLTIARFTGWHRPRGLVPLTAAYHVACWSTMGRTFGGLVMRQRVVSVDGSRLTPRQSLFRLALLPASWLLRKPLHDELAGTTVIRG